MNDPKCLSSNLMYLALEDMTLHLVNVHIQRKLLKGTQIVYKIKWINDSANISLVYHPNA